MSEPPSRRFRVQRLALWQEITLVLVIKLIALYFIWLAFFSAPSARHLGADGISQSLLRTAPSNPSQQETGHAPRPGTR
jgi:hypothetical protein